jgi:hypothetical protein
MLMSKHFINKYTPSYVSFNLLFELHFSDKLLTPAFISILLRSFSNPIEP